MRGVQVWKISLPPHVDNVTANSSLLAWSRFTQFTLPSFPRTYYSSDGCRSLDVVEAFFGPILAVYRNRSQKCVVRRYRRHGDWWCQFAIQTPSLTMHSLLHGKNKTRPYPRTCLSWWLRSSALCWCFVVKQARYKHNGTEACSTLTSPIGTSNGRSDDSAVHEVIA